jgi:hypothetical protein
MADGKVYLPKQRTNRGKAGYKGDPHKYVVIDQDTGKATTEPAVEPVKKRRGRPPKQPAP